MPIFEENSSQNLADIERQALNPTSLSNEDNFGLLWVKDNEIVAITLAYVLIVLYTSPVLLIVGSYFASDGFRQVNFAFEWFVAFMNSSDSTLNEFHKVLFPVISALSIIVFKRKIRMSMVFLTLIVLVFFVITTFVGVVFDMGKIQDAISGLEVHPDPKLVKQFFSRIQETLLMYFMMLIGIGVANSRDKASGGGK